MKVESTRLRFVKGKKLDMVLARVDSFPFKVEFKQLFKDGAYYILVFVIPDSLEEFSNITL